MARMIPPYISDDIRSEGERLAFALFRDAQGTGDWIVLHSLALSRLARRRYGELDFLVLAPSKGVFAVEVKTGRVERNEGVWEFTDRYGKTTQKTRGPFEQARDGMFAVRAELQRQLGKGHPCANHLFGFFVMFYKGGWYEDDVDHEPWQVFNGDLSNSISDFVNSLVMNELEMLLPSANRIPLTVQYANQIAGVLRRDFEQFISREQADADIVGRVYAYTKEQYACLDQMEDNERCLFWGGAGTGKTVLAMEAARRECMGGKRVLFTCYNTPLAAWLQACMKNTSQDSNLTVMGFHALMAMLAGLHQGEETDGSWFEKTLPQTVLGKTASLERYDTIVLDEAQDLSTEVYLDVLDALLNGGLAHGKWRLFGDFNMQSLYIRTNETTVLEQLSKRAGFSRYRLLLNCRNTRQICEEIQLVASIPAKYYRPSKTDGIPVSWHFFSSPSLETKEVASHVRKLIDDGVSATHIVALSTMKPDAAIMGSLREAGIPYRLPKGAGWELGPGIRLSTVHRFKGLEARYVIVYGLDNLNEYSQWLLYVGMSRAMVSLDVWLPSECRDIYNGFLIRRLANDA